jgi:hypothetical protein
VTRGAIATGFLVAGSSDTFDGKNPWIYDFNRRYVPL